ncbi:MAG: type II secretion system protein, partial [Magnetococcales bacterium]|nr:type II secretion system protein [Magnetococcales bacterium]
MKSTSHPEKGFTLIEMALVLVIAALMIGGAIDAIRAQTQKRRFDKTQDQLTDIRESIIGFAVANGRLPCPDTDFDGRENRAAGACVANASGQFTGVVPWTDLGLLPMDPWNHLFSYQVTGIFADDTALNTLNGCVETPTRSSFPLTCSGGADITIRDNAGTDLATQIPAI